PPRSPPLPYTTLFRALKGGASRRRLFSFADLRDSACFVWRDRRPCATPPFASATVVSADPTLSSRNTVRRYLGKRSRGLSMASRSEEHTSELQSRENL